MFTNPNLTLQLLTTITLILHISPATSPTKTPTTRSRTGSARDLAAAASDIAKAASEIHEEVQDSDSSDRIEHEEGNIPFEWRVQLIHKRMGQAWDHRKSEEDREKSGVNERNFDRGSEAVNGRRGGESYRKKKIDILIEEWWNNEKWNRYWWDKHDHKDEDYELVKGKRNGKKGGKGGKLSYGKGSKGRGSSPVLVYVRRGKKRPGRRGRRPGSVAQSRRRKLTARLDGRPVCARVSDEFCEEDPLYPEDLVSQLINANISRFRELIYSAQAQWESSGSRPVKEANSAGHSPICVGDIREAVPLWAPNNEGQWKLIANTTKFKQKYLIQVCTQKTLDCASTYDLTCSEQYGRLPFVALDLTSSQLHVDWFAMPFTCYCRPFTGL